jgi:UDP-GlcNAc:undecaprenyl-phosphate GlcNAc-1-phosphate transferase
VILGVPIVDSVFSFVRRVVSRQRWSLADAGHLHHRLVRLGHGPRRAVVILWAFTAILSGIALVPVYTNEGNAFVPFAAAALGLALFVFFHPGAREAREQTIRARHPAARSEDVVDLEERRRRRA